MSLCFSSLPSCFLRASFCCARSCIFSLCCAMALLEARCPTLLIISCSPSQCARARATSAHAERRRLSRVSRASPSPNRDCVAKRDFSSRRAPPSFLRIPRQPLPQPRLRRHTETARDHHGGRMARGRPRIDGAVRRQLCAAVAVNAHPGQCVAMPAAAAGRQTGWAEAGARRHAARAIKYPPGLRCHHKHGHSHAAHHPVAHQGAADAEKSHARTHALASQRLRAAAAPPERLPTQRTRARASRRLRAGRLPTRGARTRKRTRTHMRPTATPARPGAGGFAIRALRLFLPEAPLVVKLVLIHDRGAMHIVIASLGTS